MVLTQLRRLIALVAKVFNHDFFPGADAYINWLRQPVGWVIGGAFASLLVGLVIGPQGYVLMSAFLALLLVGVAWPALSMRGLSCRIEFAEPRSREGEDLLVRLEIRNYWPLPMFGLMIEGQFLQDLEHEDDRIAVALKRVPAWSTARFQWWIKPAMRGKLPTTTPLISTGFPFGLYRSIRNVELESHTIVWPRCQSLLGSPNSVGPQFSVDGSPSKRAGSEGDVIGVRGYRHGDSLRDIHWVQTARANQLFVRERQTLAQTPFCVVVDLTPAHHRGDGSQSSYEWAIRIAATICRQLHAQHGSVELRCLGITAPQSGSCDNSRGLSPLLDYLALLPADESGIPTQARSDAVALETLAGTSSQQHVHTTLICTDLSPLASGQFDQRFLMRTAGFDGLETEALPESDCDHVPTATAIIHTPRSAAVDTVSGWQGALDA